MYSGCTCISCDPKIKLVYFLQSNLYFRGYTIFYQLIMISSFLMNRPTKNTKEQWNSYLLTRKYLLRNKMDGVLCVVTFFYISFYTFNMDGMRWNAPKYIKCQSLRFSTSRPKIHRSQDKNINFYAPQVHNVFDNFFYYFFGFFHLFINFVFYNLPKIWNFLQFSSLCFRGREILYWFFHGNPNSGSK